MEEPSELSERQISKLGVIEQIYYDYPRDEKKFGSKFPRSTLWFFCCGGGHWMKPTISQRAREFKVDGSL